MCFFVESGIAYTSSLLESAPLFAARWPSAEHVVAEILPWNGPDYYREHPSSQGWPQKEEPSLVARTHQRIYSHNLLRLFRRDTVFGNMVAVPVIPNQTLDVHMLKV
ncbi:MAG TPA: hypothetical protein VKU87_03810 [Thermomicrobiaceae bacterium]|nr:hypothetical protein [Thermomicrobiaceae bacterium]